MYRIIFKLFITLSIVTPSLLAQNYRKYDVDQESMKLYGEDFKSVLKRFRRTQDYLKILQDKLGDLKTSAKEMSLQVLHYYHGKLGERINEIMPTTTTFAGETSTPRAPQILRVARLRRDEKKRNGKAYFHPRGSRKQGEHSGEAVEDSSQKIQNLDNYKVFESQLSVSERNSMRDLGFEYAGKIIHSIIENMSPKTVPSLREQFTHVPEGQSDEVTKAPTTHPPEHAVRHGNHAEGNAETVQDEISSTTKPW